ncbi:MAG: hypothetical protein N3D71_08850 [Burkholderiaceae bacterium]|nr:hypothetical protein [Burkholderiaceae bacterium]
MAFFLLVLKTLIFVAGMCLLGQFVVGIFNWGRRHENFVYQVFDIATRPVVRFVRLITPRIVLDQHVPLVAFLLLFFAYWAVGFWMRDVCLEDLSQKGCEGFARVRTEAPR